MPGLLSQLCFQAQVLCSVAITNDLSPGELPQLLARVAHHLWPTGTFAINPAPSHIRHIVEFPSGRDFWVILYLLWSVEAGTEESTGRRSQTSFSAHHHAMCLGSCQLRFLSSEIPAWGLSLYSPPLTTSLPTPVSYFILHIYKHFHLKEGGVFFLPKKKKFSQVGNIAYCNYRNPSIMSL